MARCMLCNAFLLGNSKFNYGYYHEIVERGFYKPTKYKDYMPVCETCLNSIKDCMLVFGYYSSYEFRTFNNDELKKTTGASLKSILLKNKYHEDINAQLWISEIDKLNEEQKKEIIRRKVEEELRQEYIATTEKELKEWVGEFWEKYPNRVYHSDPNLKNLCVARNDNDLAFIENCNPDFELRKWTLNHLKDVIYPKIKEKTIEETLMVTTVPLSDIISYQLVGKIDRVTTTSGGGGNIGPNIGGAIVGGLLFGTAGAIIGAGTGASLNEVQSQINEFDTRRVIVNLKNANGVAEIRELPYYFAELFNKIIPEKEFNFIQAEKGSSNVTEERPKEADSDDSAIEAVKKYKELLDMGIITEQEFNEKKKQLLGL